MEEVRDTVIAGSGLTRMAVAGLRSSVTEGNLLWVTWMVEEEKMTQLPLVGGVTRMTAAGFGSRDSEMEGDFLLCEVDGR